jgi:hypothetical protein
MPIIRTPVTVDAKSLQLMRRVKGLSRRQLAELSQVKPWRIFEIEHAVSDPCEDEIAQLLGVLATE